MRMPRYATGARAAGSAAARARAHIPALPPATTPDAITTTPFTPSPRLILRLHYFDYFLYARVTLDAYFLRSYAIS